MLSRWREARRKAAKERRRVDEWAIARRHWLRPTYVAILLVGCGLLAWAGLRGPRVPDYVRLVKLERIETTARNPVLARAAAARRAEIEGSLRHRYWHVLYYAPLVLGLGLGLFVIVRVQRSTGAIRRARRGVCTKCGYDRQGIHAEAVCPECGAAAPPPPRPSDAKGPGRRSEQAARAGAGLLFGGAGLALMIGPFRGDNPLEMRNAGRIGAAFRAAPRVTVRTGYLGDQAGAWQNWYVSDRRTGFVRQEWYANGALTEVLVDPVNGGCERYTPAAGVQRVTRTAVPPNRRLEYRNFESLGIDVLANAIWLGSERLAKGPPFAVYRSVERSALHDHLAGEIEILLIETDSWRPRFEWKWTFGEVADPNATPPHSRTWLTEIRYDDGAVASELRRIDPAAPGMLAVDAPALPAEIDPAWLDPVLGDP